MVTFYYTALKLADRSKASGTINAETERLAREMLREQELLPTSIKQVQMRKAQAKRDINAVAAGKAQSSGVMARLNERFSRVSMHDRLLFTQNMQMMVKAGIPITESLLYMESYMDNPKFRALVHALRMDIMSGNSFSKALARHKDIFNNIYVGIIQAGEASGELETVLKRLTDMLSGQMKLNKKISAAMTYPIILVVIVSLVLVVMFTFVLPVFGDMYEKMGVPLPMITQVMLGISGFIRNFWWLALIMAICAGVGIRALVISDSGRQFLDKAILRVPVASQLVRMVSASNFISTLHVSFGAGLPITDCIWMACQTVGNRFLRFHYDEVNLKIQAGQRLASALDDASVLPPVNIIMISTGEEAGSLDTMLAHCLEYLEGEVNHLVERLMALMEPTLLVIMGVIVLAMALSIYLPLFGMYENI